ncbi:MAG: CDP-glucose 4,6-dehydratase [Deltaproteobacteria bacterium]|nr:CDP-glucose 4,6-dehydratase [Deltaproteobacteria bacterium]
MFNDIYRNRTILVTGHTGFKGSWLALWLTRLGANVVGYALAPPTDPSHFKLLDMGIRSIEGDIRDGETMKRAFREVQPEAVFHLAAQAIVRRSYQEPAATLATNVMGTVHVLEAARACGSVRAIVNVTSDKRYENREWPWGYREIDPLGGFDPYSASKGCSELITGSWRNSFFNPGSYGRDHHTLLASGRAGNVIGGGDWAADRLIPDIMRAVHRNERVTIRNPQAVRPWQHVLEPLSGYLLLGQKLLEGRTEFAEAWNFGPPEEGSATVGEICAQIQAVWPKIDWEIKPQPGQPHEAGLLRLDCSKARAKLDWSPVWSGKTAIEKTALWYRTFYETGSPRSSEDLDAYIDGAKDNGMAWAAE